MKNKMLSKNFEIYQLEIKVLTREETQKNIKECILTRNFIYFANSNE